MTRFPMPAWIAMMPMLCAIMSCSSRAMRSRSLATAWAAASARCRAAPARRSRVELPISQATRVSRLTTTTCVGISCEAPMVNGRHGDQAAGRMRTAAFAEVRRGQASAMASRHKLAAMSIA